MNAEEIYQALKKQGFNASKVAEALDVRPQSVATVIRQGRGSKRVAKAVAIACNKPFETVFPFYKEKREQAEQRVVQVNQLKSDLGVL